MLRIALISCNLTADPYPVYPLGPAMLAHFIRSKGYDLKEFDLLRGSTPEDVKFFQPDLIGLSLRNIDNINYSEQETYFDKYSDIADAFRNSCPDVPIVLGGSAFSMFPEELMALTSADYGITGEGELAFLELIKTLESGRVPENKIIRYHGQCSDFAGGERDSLAADFYFKKGGMLNIQTKRGCPHRCIYCSYPYLEGHEYRFRPPESVVDEIELILRAGHGDYIFFTDSVFNDRSGRYLKLAESILSRNLKFRWMAFFRPDLFSKDEIAILKRSGLDAVEWGTDAASDATLAGMKKDFCWETVTAANNAFADAGIASAHFIIFGGPGETPETLREGLENIAALKKSLVMAALGLRIYPGTALYEKALSEKLIRPGQNLLKPEYYISPALDGFETEKIILDSFRGRRDRIFTWSRENLVMVEKCHMMGFKGPAWNLLLK